MITRHQLPILFFAALVLAPQALPAQTIWTYDLDSELYMAPEVVQASIVGSHKEKDLDVDDIQITRVYQGQLTEKQVMVAALDYFRVAADDDGMNHRKLRIGEHVILFLDRAREGFAFSVPKDAVIYMPIPGGVRLISADKIYGFTQWDNPGPYVTDPKPGKIAPPTLDAYRLEIAAHQKVVDAFRTNFAARMTHPDQLLEHLTEHLKTAPANRHGERDHLAEVLTAELAKTKDPELLEKTLTLGYHAYSDNFDIIQGFAAPKGREYILKAIGDEHAPLERRLRLAQLLPRMWPWYGQDIEGKAPAGNGNYLLRIATLALNNAAQENLCSALVASLTHMAQVMVQTKDEELWKDWRQAEEKLATLAARGVSEGIAYELEIALATTDVAAYRKLNPKCGSVITRVVDIPDQTTQYRKNKRTHVLSCTYITSIEWGAAKPDHWEIVARNLNTNDEFVTPVAPELDRGNMNTTGPVTPPATAAPGKYRLWLRGKLDGKTISEGHFADVDFQ